jgi:superfamily II DNA helicase RecQ
LTATASEIVKKDIISYLDIKYVVEESSLNRPNLSLQIIPVEQASEKPERIKALLQGELDTILGHIANLKDKTITPISQKTEK